MHGLLYSEKAVYPAWSHSPCIAASSIMSRIYTAKLPDFCALLSCNVFITARLQCLLGLSQRSHSVLTADSSVTAWRCVLLTHLSLHGIWLIWQCMVSDWSVSAWWLTSLTTHGCLTHLTLHGALWLTWHCMMSAWRCLNQLTVHCLSDSSVTEW